MTIFQCMIVAAILLVIYLFAQFIVLKKQYHFCIKYSFFTKHILNMTSCSFKVEGVVTQCNMDFRNYTFSGKLNEFVDVHFSELFNERALAGWVEELLDSEVIVSPQNKEKPFALYFRKDKLLEVLNDFSEASHVILEKYSKQGIITQMLLKEEYEFLKLFKDDMAKEAEAIKLIPGNVITLCGEK